MTQKKMTFLFQAISLLGFSALISCSNIQNENKTVGSSFYDTVHYDDFWDAVLSFDTSYVTRKDVTVTNEQLSFSNAMKLLLKGKRNDFNDSLKKLFENTNDTLVLDNCYRILNNNLMYEFKWADLIELDKTFYSKLSQLLQSNIIMDEETIKYNNLYSKLAQIPKTSYSFSETADTIPIYAFAGNAPIIEVQVNGKSKLFFFDTGAGNTAIFSDISKECNVFPVTPDSFAAGTATSKIIYAPYTVCNFSIGKMNIYQSLAVIDDVANYAEINNEYPYKINGILGWETIQNMDVVIDYFHKIIVINRPVKRVNEKPNLFNLSQPIVIGQSEQKIPLFLFYDTGSDGSYFYSRIKKKLQFEKLHREKTEHGGAGEIEEIEVEIVPEATIFVDSNKITLKNVEIHERTDFIHLDGILGSDIGRKGSLRFDYTNGFFEFKNIEQKNSSSINN